MRSGISSYDVDRKAPIIAREVGPMRRHDLVMLIANRCGCSYDLANSAVNREVDKKYILRNDRKQSKLYAELASLRADLATVTAERDASRAAEKHWQEIAKAENDTANNLRDAITELRAKLATYERMKAVRQ